MPSLSTLHLALIYAIGFFIYAFTIFSFLVFAICSYKLMAYGREGTVGHSKEEAEAFWGKLVSQALTGTVIVTVLGLLALFIAAIVKTLFFPIE